MSKWYAATEMTGSDEALDMVPTPGDFTDLSTGDKCFVLVGNLHLRIYEYDTASTESDDIFGLSLIPADNATGQGAWEQVRTSGLITTLAGSFANQIHGLVTESGGTVSLDFEGNGGIPGLGIWSDELVTVPIQSVVLNAGSDEAPTANYVHVLKADPVTLVTDTEWPATEHIKVAYILCPSAAHVASEGVYINQNWNDGNEPNGMGHRTLMGENIRLTMDGAHWHSGVAANGATDGYITIVTGDTPDSAYFLSTAGVCYQMHRHTVSAKNTTSVDDIHVVNAYGAPYNLIHDIRDIEVDALNGSLTNKYYNIVFWMVANKSGEYSPVMMNMPTGAYVGLSSAIQDVDGFDVYDIPREFKEESSTGFLVCRITFRQTASAITVHNTTDLRGRTPGTASGTSIGGETEFADNQFNIFNVLDNTKIVDFDLSNIVTGNTRTIEIPNGDMIIPTGTFAGATELNFAGVKTLESWTVETQSGIKLLSTDQSVSVLLYANDAGESIWSGQNLSQLMKIQSRDDEDHVNVMFNGDPDGAVELYFNGSKMFETSVTGIVLPGLNADNETDQNDIDFMDSNANVMASLVGRRGVSYTLGEFFIRVGVDKENALHATKGGATELYHAGVKAFETFADGPVIYNTSTASAVFGLQLLVNTVRFGMYGYQHGVPFQVSAENNSGDPKDIITGDPDGAAELYYAGVKTFYTKLAGIVIAGTSGVDLLQIFDSTGEVVIAAMQNSDHIILRGKDDGGSNSLVFLGDPDGAAELYYDGTKILETQSLGVTIHTAAGELWLIDDGISLQFRSTVHGYPVSIWGENNDGNLKRILQGDPDGACDFYQLGIRAFATNYNGISIYDTSGDDPAILLYSDAATLQGAISMVNGDMVISVSAENGIKINEDGAVNLYYNGTLVVQTNPTGIEINRDSGTNYGGDVYMGVNGDMILWPREPEAGVVLYGTNTSSVSKILLQGDPDGALSIMWAGSVKLSTVAGGVYITGDCSALTFTDRTPYYEGSAVEDINKIKGKDGKIDHATLPDFAHRPGVPAVLPTDPEDPEDLGTPEIPPGRDLGAMISILVKAVQELSAEVEALKR